MQKEKVIKLTFPLLFPLHMAVHSHQLPVFHNYYFKCNLKDLYQKHFKSFCKPTHHLQLAKLFAMSSCCLAIDTCAVALPESQRTIYHPAILYSLRKVFIYLC